MRKGPIDVAEWLGLVPPALPKPVRYGAFRAERVDTPPEIIKGLLHQECKMVLAGTSKTNKTWSLLDLAMSVASGQKWWGLETVQGRVLYLNFELPDWAVLRRGEAIQVARPELKGVEDYLTVWNLRGHSSDFTTLRPKLMDEIRAREYQLIVLDPAYKLLGDRDENSNGEITGLMNEFEKLCYETGAALVLAHHFAKGDPTVKDPIDRMSGAGAWARDPDTILVLTPHEERDCYTVNSIVRNMRAIGEFVVEWDYPIMKRAEDLDPKMVRTRYTQRKALTDRDFLDVAVGSTGSSSGKIIERAQALGCARSTAQRYLTRLCRAGAIVHGGGLYWKAGSKDGEARADES